MAVVFAVAGWSYPDWRGRVYPLRRRVDPLRYLSRFVDGLEINSTFYRPPAARVSESWCHRVADRTGFFFTAKLHRGFTHERRLDDAELCRAFAEGIRPLEQAGRLRCLLAQFRYDFTDTPANREHLARLAERWGRRTELVVELRHRSWQRPEAVAFVTDLGVGLCHLDYPAGREGFTLELAPPASLGYFRLHGRNQAAWYDPQAGRDQTYDYCYGPGELQQIHERLRRMAERFSQLVVVTNNHFRGAAVANALELRWLWTGRRTVVPAALLESYPQLERFAVPDVPREGTLFQAD